MSLPLNVIKRLFERLTVTYGWEWTAKWEGIETVALEALWGHELSQFSDCLEVVAWALENLPEKCPNAIEFKSLCRQAPRKGALQIGAQKASQAVVDAELARLTEGVLKPMKERTSSVDHKRWAKALKARHDSGEALGMFQIRAYRTALGIEQVAA